jgi:hypothetical protein
MQPTLTATIGRPLCLSISLILFAACAREELSLGSGEPGLQAPLSTGSTASSPPGDAAGVTQPPQVAPPSVPPTPGPATTPAPPAQPTVGGACGSMTCGANSACCTFFCGVGLPGGRFDRFERRAFCAQGPSCNSFGPGLIATCDYCNTDSDCRIVDQTCTDPASDCACRGYSKSSGEPVSCRPCDAQACANKGAFCMITGTAPVPAPPAGQPPTPAKPEGICAVRDAP